MKFDIKLSDKAKKDIEFHKKSGNMAILKKIKKLILEITENPFTGTGKPEPLKHTLSGYWSRRINREHRMIYKVEGQIIEILSLKGHY